MKELTLANLFVALKRVNDPETNKDLVTLNRVREIKINGNSVSFKVLLTPRVMLVKEKLSESILASLKADFSEAEFQFECLVDPRAAIGPSSQQNNSIPGVKAVVAVSSGKGGVGKSTISSNLAIALALKGYRVGLLDCDIHGPNIPTMMGITEEPKIEMDEVKGEMFIPPEAHGVKVMSMGFMIAPDQALIWRGPMLHQAVNQFCHKVRWGALDYLVIDMPPGTGDVQLSLAQAVKLDGVVLVTTPQEVAAQDVRRAYFMWEKVNVPIIGIVENMSYFETPDTKVRYAIFGEGAGARLSRKFNTHLLAQVPIEMGIRSGADDGRPVVVSQAQSASAKVLNDLAGSVDAWILTQRQNSEKAAPGLEIGNFS